MFSTNKVATILVLLAVSGVAYGMQETQVHSLSTLPILNISLSRSFRTSWEHAKIVQVNHSNYDSPDAFHHIKVKLRLLHRLLNAINARNLIDLNISGNRLIGLPSVISQFANLRKINLSKNELEPEPLRLLFRKCHYLQDVDLSHNKLEELPYEIIYLKQLERLNLFQNQLTPEAIKNICVWNPGLRELNLCFNGIQKLPASLRNLRNLRKLWLAYNCLETDNLNPLFALAKHLQTLDLSGNGLFWLPEELLTFHALRLLRLERNFFNEEAKEGILSRFRESVPRAEIVF